MANMIRKNIIHKLDLIIENPTKSIVKSKKQPPCSDTKEVFEAPNAGWPANQVISSYQVASLTQDFGDDLVTELTKYAKNKNLKGIIGWPNLPGDQEDRNKSNCLKLSKVLGIDDTNC